MKVRIGLSARTRGDDLAGFVDEAERLQFDSLWVSEQVTGETLDPIVAMTFIAARTARMKVGTSVMVLPGRNPVLLAKALASLDVLSGGRILPAFGLGVPLAAEHQAFGVERDERAPLFDEALPLMRRLWSEDHVTHHGDRFRLDDVSLRPKPLAGKFDVWLGGASRAQLARCGRLGDGWLAAFMSPPAVGAGIDVVHAAAAAAGREIDPEHFGVSIAYVDGPIPTRIVDVVQARDPDARPEDVIAASRAELRGRIEEYVAVGASKFVVVPLSPPLEPKGWTDELESLAEQLLPLQT